MTGWGEQEKKGLVWTLTCVALRRPNPRLDNFFFFFCDSPPPRCSSASGLSPAPTNLSIKEQQKLLQSVQLRSGGYLDSSQNSLHHYCCFFLCFGSHWIIHSTDLFKSCSQQNQFLLSFSKIVWNHNQFLHKLKQMDHKNDPICSPLLHRSVSFSGVYSPSRSNQWNPPPETAL